MSQLYATLQETIKRTPTIVSFRFTIPENVKFLPGQFLQVIFDEEKQENKDLNKYLSISSSPSKDYIEITKRISNSEFSKKLLSLKANEKVLVKLPLGTCVFKDEFKKIGFLIGGIGITPVISIIEHIYEKKLDTDVKLFYSNRNEEEIAFRKELDMWQKQGKHIDIFYTITECQPKDTSCLFGYINKEMLQKNICDIQQRILYIFGPPVMVDTMANLLKELDCKNENIKLEKFVGY